MNDRWRPNVTVAAVVVKDNHYLMVEELPQGAEEPVLNQPAGHLEQGESLVEAVRREVLEETRWEVEGLRVSWCGDVDSQQRHDLPTPYFSLFSAIGA
jgi:ADP-ribose pyrophosphatase YjhB (NUDIX family)